MDREELIKKITARTFISQKDAANIIGISKGQICNLIKLGKIEAYKEGNTPKPYLNSVLEYKANPNMKRINIKKEELDEMA